MSYTIGTTQVIKDDNTTQLNTASTGFIEIGPLLKSPQVGSSTAFTSGGSAPTAPNGPVIDNIYKYPFANMANQQDINSLTESKYGMDGHSSSIDGFMAGGYTNPSNGNVNKIERFSYTSSVASSQVGTLNIYRHNGASHSSPTDGFVSAGYGTPGNSPPFFAYIPGGQIEKFPFAISSGTATNVAESWANMKDCVGLSSLTDGFTFGGEGPSSDPKGPFYGGTRRNELGKFPFAISSGSSSLISRHQSQPYESYESTSACESTTDGFINGGSQAFPSTVKVTDVRKFPFALSGTVMTSYIQVLTTAVSGTFSHSSGDHGFVSCGVTGPTSITDVQKFPFTSLSNGAATVANLSFSISSCGTHQV